MRKVLYMLKNHPESTKEKPFYVVRSINVTKFLPGDIVPLDEVQILRQNNIEFEIEEY